MTGMSALLLTRRGAPLPAAIHCRSPDRWSQTVFNHPVARVEWEKVWDSRELTGVQLIIPGPCEQPLLAGKSHDVGCYRFGIFELNNG